MRIRCVLLVSCVLLISALVGCGCDSLAGLDKPEQLTLYSLDGRDFEPGQEPKTEEKLYSYPVLGKVEITDAAKRQEIVAALKRGLAQSEGKMAGCFWPRHALRVVEKGRTVDYVICFECGKVEAHEGSSKWVKPLTPEPQAILNKYLKEAGIPLAPGVAGKER